MNLLLKTTSIKHYDVYFYKISKRETDGMYFFEDTTRPEIHFNGFYSTLNDLMQSLNDNIRSRWNLEFLDAEAEVECPTCHGKRKVPLVVDA